MSGIVVVESSATLCHLLQRTLFLQFTLLEEAPKNATRL